MQARPRIQSIHARREEGAEVTDESVTWEPRLGQGEGRRGGGTRLSTGYSLFVQGFDLLSFDLLDQGVNFFRC